MLASIIFGAVFITIGIAFFTGFGLRYVKGWQQMPKEERDKINITAVCRNIGTAIALGGALLLLAGLSPVFMAYGFRWAMVGWLVLCGLDVYYIGKSPRYSKKG